MGLVRLFDLIGGAHDKKLSCKYTDYHGAGSQPRRPWPMPREIRWQRLVTAPIVRETPQRWTPGRGSAMRPSGSVQRYGVPVGADGASNSPPPLWQAMGKATFVERFTRNEVEAFGDESMREGPYFRPLRTTILSRNINYFSGTKFRSFREHFVHPRLRFLENFFLNL